MSHTPSADWQETSIASIDRDEANVLVLDYCDLERDGERISDIHVLAADRRLWNWAGAPENAWDRAVQFRRTILERSWRTVRPRITYRFDVDPALVGHADEIGVIVERQRLYTVSVNGHDIPDADFDTWRMEDFRIASIGTYLVPGENTITLGAGRFHPLMEIAPVTIAGSFTVVPGTRGFRIVAEQVPAMGNIARNGLPFYPGEIGYTVALPEPVTAAEIEFEFDGAFAEVRTGDDSIVVYHSPARVTIGCTSASRAEHDTAVDRPVLDSIEIRVGASAQNYFGPWHSEGLALSFTWARSPEHQPAGDAYRSVPFGLAGAPRVRALPAEREANR